MCTTATSLPFRVLDTIERGEENLYAIVIVNEERVRLETAPLPGVAEIDTQIWICEFSAPVCGHREGQLARDDDGGEGFYSALELSLAPGAYLVGVRDLFGNSAGGYTLRIHEVP